MPTVFVDEVSDFLVSAGYSRRDLVKDCPFTVRALDGTLDDRRVDLAAFAQSPHDMRNACIVAFDDRPEKTTLLENLRYLTAPLAIVAKDKSVELWAVRKQVDLAPFDVLDRTNWTSRLRTRLSDFAPKTITDAKADRIQLDFVDAGLAAWTQGITSGLLKTLLEDLIGQGMEQLSAKARAQEQAQDDVLRLVFHLFTCRALEDKGVLAKAETPETALRRASRLYSANINPNVLQSPFLSKQLVLRTFEHLRSRFSFATLTSDILSHSYENALVTRSTRRKLGIYYTPRAITEYIVRRLPIEVIPQASRFFWDPCCGCGSFLLAAFDRLSQLLPDDMARGERHRYLRQRIFGSDMDSFARELASLTLVLTDLHNSNGWNVKQLDARRVTRDDVPRPPTIIATNLPFKEIKEGHGQRGELSADILERLIQLSPDGGLLSAIVPQSFLDSRAASASRKKILQVCDVFEIDLLPGAFFKSAAETAVLMLRKRGAGRVITTTVRELRSSDYPSFIRSGSFTRTYPVDQGDWKGDPNARFHVSPLSDLWARLSSLPRLHDLATVSNGLQIKKTDKDSVSPKRRAGDKPFVDRLDVLRPFALLTEIGVHQKKWLRYGPQLHRARREEIFQGNSVLINSNRNPGSAWRLVAAICRSELYFSDNFHAVTPRQSAPVTPEQLAAVLNSPIANAWFDSHCRKRKVVLEVLEQLPMPVFDERLGKKLGESVRRMESAARAKWRRVAEGSLFYDSLEGTADTAELLVEIDQLVYESYALSDQDRSHIDRLMSGDKRPS